MSQKKKQPKRTSSLKHYCREHGEIVGYEWGGHRRHCRAGVLTVQAWLEQQKERRQKKARPVEKVHFVKNSEFETAVKSMGVAGSIVSKTDKMPLGLQVDKITHTEGVVARAEIQPGNVITRISGQKIAKEADVVKAVARVRSKPSAGLTFEFADKKGKTDTVFLLPEGKLGKTIHQQSLRKCIAQTAASTSSSSKESEKASKGLPTARVSRVALEPVSLDPLPGETLEKIAKTELHANGFAEARKTVIEEARRNYKQICETKIAALQQQIDELRAECSKFSENLGVLGQA